MSKNLPWVHGALVRGDFRATTMWQGNLPLASPPTRPVITLLLPPHLNFSLLAEF